MKRYLSLILILFSWIFLFSCSSQSQIKFNRDLSFESWMPQIETDPARWSRGASLWFLTGDANAVERNPSARDLSTMKINAPHFTRIKTSGDFKVEIFGTSSQNSVYVYGPTEAVSDTMITVKGDTLYLNQRPKISRRMHQVIIRIGVNQLDELVQRGRGRVEGVRLTNGCLTVVSAGPGHIYLAGHINLSRILNFSSGCVSVFGVNSPIVDIKNYGMGSTNVSGNVGIRSIVHYGAGNINIVGANSNSLSIAADGGGKIGISGTVSLCSLKVTGQVRVYVCGVMSQVLNITAEENACIGLSGSVNRLTINAYNRAFVGARNLCADESFVTTRDQAHVNVAGTRKIFATSANNSSIYFFGSRDILTKFASDNGFVMQMCTKADCCSIKQPEPQPEPLRMRGAG